MWIETGPKQHMNKSTASYENESNHIQNVSSEHEDGQANLVYDPTWHVTTDSNENESDSTYNDSDLGLGYA